MGFMVVYTAISFLCVVLTALPLTAYSDCTPAAKYLIYAVLAFAWFSPVFVWNLQNNKRIPVRVYALIAKTSYFAEGYAFLLMTVLLARDIIWWTAYYAGFDFIISPLAEGVALKANVITAAAVFAVCLYGIYAAEKMPRVLHFKFADTRIKKPLKILAVSDLHITRMTPLAKIRTWVNYFNSLGADLIVMVGDAADDDADGIRRQIAGLSKLRAPLGIYYVLGNHETYFNPYVWEAEFAALGWQVLHNSGAAVDDTGIYIAGIPDNRAFRADIKQSLKNAGGRYSVLLSHIPSGDADAADADLVISGHTHGGQIFPFNLLSKLGNHGMSAGLYNRYGTNMLVSRGAGYWGPPMRICAPSDVMFIELEPE